MRFQDLLIQYYHPNSLRVLGNIIDQTMKMDFNTQNSQKGKFARVAVDIDLHQLLKSYIAIEIEKQHTGYEGLPTFIILAGWFSTLVSFIRQGNKEIRTSTCKNRWILQWSLEM